MGKKASGVLYFFVDSEPSASKDYSPPGQIYTEAPDSYRNLFISGETSVIETTDRWGNWTSAFVPLKDPQTKKIIAYFAIDTDATQWALSSLIELDITLFPTILAMLFVLYLWQRTDTQDMLAVREAKYRFIWDNVQDVFYETSIDGTIAEVSPSIKALSKEQYCREELINKSLFDFYANKDQRIAVIAELVKNGIVNDYEVELKNKDNSIVQCSVSARIMLDPKSGSTKIIGSLRDISVRKEADKKLADSEYRYRLLVDTAMEAILISQGGVYLKFVNPRATEIIGYTKEELLAMPFVDLVYPDDRKLVKDNYYKRISGEKTAARYQFRIITKNKLTKWVEMSGVKIDWEGQPATLNMVTDITEQKRIEDELRHSRELFSKAFATSPDSININRFDDGVYLAINEGFTRTTGYTEEDVIGKSSVSPELAIWTNPKDRQILLDELNKNGEMVGFETKFKTKDNREIIGLMSAKVLYNNNEKTIISITRDITKFRQTEQAVRERERLSAVGELASGVAHDFNNSLQVIIGNADLIATNANDANQVIEQLEAIKRCAYDAAARVVHLQKFGKPSSAKELCAIDINILLDEVIAQAQPTWKNMAEKSGIVINILKKYQNSLTINGNSGEIRSAVYNIIKNAVDAMPFGGNIVFEISLENNMACVDITDTGIGMDEETRKKVFQPFFTTKGFDKGKGLGMTSTYSAIRDHGGEISIKATAINKGTTVRILLPICAQQINSIKQEKLNKKVAAKVLFVDDDDALREIWEKRISRDGHSVDVASGGHEAMQLLESKSYNIMITDIGMPKMNGWQLASAIKDKYPSMQIVVLTGWGADVDEHEMAKYGVKHVLGKPIDSSAILDLIANSCTEYSAA
jgi:PAS domain S-box-containing protein